MFKILCLLFVLLLQSSVLKAFSCYELFKPEQSLYSRTWDSLFKTQEFKDLSFDDLNHFKSIYYQKLLNNESIDTAPPISAVQKLAFLEAVAQYKNYDILNLRTFMESATDREKTKLERAFQKLDFTSGITEQKLYNFLIKAYLISNTPKGIFKTLLNGKLPKPLKNLIKKRIDYALLTNGYLEIFEKLGFVRKTDSRQRILRAQRMLAPYEKSTLSLALFGITTHFLGIPISLPFVEPSSTINISREIEEYSETARINGLNAVYDQALQKYGGIFKREIVWKFTRKVYQVAFLGLAATTLMEIIPVQYRMIRINFITSEQLAQYQKENFDLQELRHERFNNWKGSFYNLEGRYPNPEVYPQDRDEWELEWKRAYESPRESFVVEF